MSKLPGAGMARIIAPFFRCGPMDLQAGGRVGDVVKKGVVCRSTALRISKG